MPGGFVGRSGPQDRIPTIKLFIGPVVTVFELLRGKTRGTIDHMTCVVEIPIAGFDTVTRSHLREERCAGIRCENVKGRGGNAILDGPIDGPSEHIPVITVQTENKAAVNHNPQVIQPARHLAITAPKILTLA